MVKKGENGFESVAMKKRCGNVVLRRRMEKSWRKMILREEGKREMITH